MRSSHLLSRITALAAFTAMLFSTAAIGEMIKVPFGTVIFCELDQHLSTKKKRSDFAEEGDLVRVKVWKDVRVDGRVVVEAGTPAYARISRMKKARIAGRRGILEIEVLQVTAIDGTDIHIEGGYDKSGRGRMGLSIALAAVVAWPLVFLKGKSAFLEPGTIFDAQVRASAEVDVPDHAKGPAISLGEPLRVEVLYDELDPEKKIKHLPLLIITAEPATSASVKAVNGKSIEPLAIMMSEGIEQGEYRGTLDFKGLSKHFAPGMNRLEVWVGDAHLEILVEIEL